MKRHIVLAVTLVTVLGLAVLVAREIERNQSPSTESKKEGAQSVVSSESCLADECLAAEGLDFPVGTLTPAVQDALRQALEDEYRAAATYAAVLEKFGMKRPFSMIIRAEEQHISRLKALYDKYGMTVPENSYFGLVVAPASFSAACQTGVAAEIANVALYEKQLIPVATEYPDIVRVFENLRDASRFRHVPAFERCQ